MQTKKEKEIKLCKHTAIKFLDKKWSNYENVISHLNKKYIPSIDNRHHSINFKSWTINVRENLITLCHDNLRWLSGQVMYMIILNIPKIFDIKCCICRKIFKVEISSSFLIYTVKNTINGFRIKPGLEQYELEDCYCVYPIDYVTDQSDQSIIVNFFKDFLYTNVKKFHFKYNKLLFFL